MLGVESLTYILSTSLSLNKLDGMRYCLVHQHLGNILPKLWQLNQLSYELQAGHSSDHILQPLLIMQYFVC